jgi:hypothetical protein
MPRPILVAVAVAIGISLAASRGLRAQEPNRVTPEPKVPLRWDRFYDYPEMEAALRRLAAAHPGWLTIASIGKSVEGRDFWMVTLASPDGPPPEARPAMYIDANVHGNEVQGTEVCLYTLWYLLENRDRLPKVRDLLARVAFYILPTVNPDGRQHWFDAPNTSSSSRSGKAPVDNDRDGLFDEDGPDDLDGDGSVTQMRKRVERGGTHILDPDEPRLLKAVEPGMPGEYVLLGQEGIDNDGDGDINEDPPGGYDMNRNWPSDWQPNWLQFGAGDYPLNWPETRATADFLLAHPNVAAVQSYHNAGGMILRGPGTKDIPEYPGADLRVYDELGRAGEAMLPNYRYMLLWRDLYPVHGGFVTWAFEGLGIFSFTNELWNDAQYGGPAGDGQRSRLLWQERLELGGSYKAWTPYEHPLFGPIEIGGFTKTSSRVPPLFMLEELCHRNMAFTLHHADAMPQLSLNEPAVEDLGNGLWRVRAEVRNEKLIPSISALARQKKLGVPDRFELAGEGVRVLAGGILSGPPLRERVANPQRHLPARLLIEGGVPSFGTTRVEWLFLCDGVALPPLSLTYASDKGGTVRWPR